MKPVKVTKNNFLDYLRVQNGGRYNMLTPQAQAATGLSDSVYTEIIQNYGNYFARWGNAKKSKT